jgi:hypothetical protein
MPPPVPRGWHGLRFKTARQSERPAGGGGQRAAVSGRGPKEGTSIPSRQCPTGRFGVGAKRLRGSAAAAAAGSISLSDLFLLNRRLMKNAIGQETKSSVFLIKCPQPRASAGGKPIAAAFSVERFNNSEWCEPKNQTTDAPPVSPGRLGRHAAGQPVLGGGCPCPRLASRAFILKLSGLAAGAAEAASRRRSRTDLGAARNGTKRSRAAAGGRVAEPGSTLSHTGSRRSPLGRRGQAKCGSEAWKGGV